MSEEEKKYIVKMPKTKNCYFVKSVASEFSKEFYNMLDHLPEMWDKSWQFVFTEKEIKNIDERYWLFAVEVIDNAKEE